MKKILLGFFGGLILSIAPIAYAMIAPPKPIDFTDVNEGDWYFDTVNDLSIAGYTEGYTDGSFRPNNPITRAETAKFIMQLDSLIKSNSYQIASLSNKVETLEAKLNTLDLPGDCFYEDTWFLEGEIFNREVCTGLCVTETCTCQIDGSLECEVTGI